MEKMTHAKSIEKGTQERAHGQVLFSVSGAVLLFSFRENACYITSYSLTLVSYTF